MGRILGRGVLSSGLCSCHGFACPEASSSPCGALKDPSCPCGAPDYVIMEGKHQFYVHGTIYGTGRTLAGIKSPVQSYFVQPCV